MALLQNIDYEAQVPAALMQPVINEQIERLRSSGAGSYEHVFDQTERAVQRADVFDRKRLVLVPAISFALDTTLQIVADQEVQGQLPDEIDTRKKLAQRVAVAVVGEAVRQHAFYDAYKGRGKIAVVASQEEDVLTNRTSIAQIAAAPFRDVAWVAGGAVAALTKSARGVENRQTAIRRSLDLLEIATISEKALKLPERAAFGEPYLNAKHLYVLIGKSPTKVKYREAFIKQLRTGGTPHCPVLAMPSETGGTILRRSWEGLVNYLVTPPEPLPSDEPPLVQ